ncbi:helicase HerA domain-containing protein [Nonomuraea sp. KM88]|uniref:helicase HerA domain-containing protein n=1 Tax=Nonomuraea sp. KM88 TaxID=3457427 RepID=UPI003FCE30C0
MELKLAALARHTAVFAGSGSGKTVFLRRLVEECALHGVSSIVLDSNNDLARLGDPWPEAPPGWGPGDADKAARYFAETEVVVWTPGRSRGRPLTFRPLPDFGAVLDDRDELDSALGLAVGALVRTPQCLSHHPADPLTEQEIMRRASA